MTESLPPGFIARYRKSDGTPQWVAEHLTGVADLASAFAGKIGLPVFGELMGMLHDLGKYSTAFQAYIKSAGGKIEPDEEDYVDAERMRGKIDHSSAGAQYVYNHRKENPFRQNAIDLMAICIASHHSRSGLIDCLSPDGTGIFYKRITKSQEQTHLDEVAQRLEEQIERRVQKIMAADDLESQLMSRLRMLWRPEDSVEVRQFLLGFLARFLFSALIDADRLHSAERQPRPKQEWPLLVEILEANLAGLTTRNRIDEIRADISASCLHFAGREKGLYQLTVPTGGGKTLASLRFAMHHASRHKMDRIIYVVPYTSIIDQNARVARSLFAFLEEGGRQVVLEHHSNLTPEHDTGESKLLAENWDAPIIFTTAVQFLETLFAAGTRGVRRLHQLANAVIVFDEIQTIPIRTVHLFNNAVNFLVSQCGATVVFCTATQPLLDRVAATKGAARLSSDSQMMGDVAGLFRDLQRVTIEDGCKDEGWTTDEVMEATLHRLAESGSVLVIVNKKAQARELFQQLHGKVEHLYHLSTSMCPAHRAKVLDSIKAGLDSNDPVPVICVSTQLIEAGVDVDFGAVIRYLAGLDSIAQAAGRCNRNGRRQTGRVLLVNIADEGLDSLPEIRLAQEVTRRVLRESKENPAAFDHDLQSPKAMERYYFYYFFNRAHEMAFPVAIDGVHTDLLTLLSTNSGAVQEYMRIHRQAPMHRLCQAFASAAKEFKAIDSPTEGVIVPYGEGERIIAELSDARFEDKSRLLKEAQRYSVNLFPYEKTKLLEEKKRLYETWQESGIFWLDERHYSEEFGVCMEEVSEMKTLIG